MKKRTSLLALAAIMTAFAGKAALAADLAPPPPPPPAPEIRASVSDWTGPYLGVVLGGTCMDTNTTLSVDFVDPGDTDTSIDPALNGCGFSGGIVGGFNYQIQNVVLGFEGDWTWGSKKTGRHTDITGAGDTIGEYYHVKWMASPRIRLGVLATDETLFYVTGGPSWMRGTMEDIITGQKFTKTHVGYTLGGGIEHALTENIHLRAEYLFSSYKKKDYGPFFCSGCGTSGANITASNDMDQFHSFRAGVTWNFPVSTW